MSDLSKRFTGSPINLEPGDPSRRYRPRSRPFGVAPVNAMARLASPIKHSLNVLAFTEQQVATLSGILNSDRAIKVNIAIMRVLVRIRELLANRKEMTAK